MKYLLYVLVFIIGTKVYSQRSDSYGQNLVGSFHGVEKVDLLYDSNINGNSYLYGSWNMGVLVMNDTLFLNQNNLRYDAYQDRILIKKGENLNDVFEINDDALTGFSILEEKTNLKHNFLSLKGNNLVDNSLSGYFEIVENSSKTNYLLKRVEKYIYDPNKSKGVAAQNNLQSEFKTKTSYFLKNEENKYVQIRLKKKDVLSVLSEHKAEIDKFVKLNKVRFSNEEEIIELVNYYYSM